jgi:hypothetical protein
VAGAGEHATPEPTPTKAGPVREPGERSA